MLIWTTYEDLGRDIALHSHKMLALGETRSMMGKVASVSTYT